MVEGDFKYDKSKYIATDNPRVLICRVCGGEVMNSPHYKRGHSTYGCAKNLEVAAYRKAHPELVPKVEW